MIDRIRYLLLQVRNADDSMRGQELECFSRALECDSGQIDGLDLLHAVPSKREVNAADVILIGGSGHYGTVREAAWLERALDFLREIHGAAKPTFASCWGFQAMSRAMGGRVVKESEWSELGTIELQLTRAGQEDPVFGSLGSPFDAQMGHEDCVVELPADAIRLASSQRVENQAFRFEDKPIYCTQFHPELQVDNLLERLRVYPQYVERISGLPFEEFAATCRQAPRTEKLILRFVKLIFSR